MKRANKILAVDDDKAHRTMLKTLLGGWGYDITMADDGSTAIDAVEKEHFDLVLMDIKMLKVSGIEALGQIKRYNPAIPVIIMTAYSSVDTAVEALKKGAYDYLTKPLDFDKLKLTMEKAMEHILLKKENLDLKQKLGMNFDRTKIIGRSAAMTNLLETVEQVALSEATILIKGDSGTGKELIAGAVHYNSGRADGPFIKINCAAITESLLESELFGHEKGAFTGAVTKKEGRFLKAHTGSIFLDEVSEMPPSMQVKLLRVIQEREITPVGGDENIKIDVRIITATNKKLEDLVEKEAFREDLYYRLNVVALELPALNKRREDIPILAMHFLKQFSKHNNKEIKGLTPEAMENLIKYEWPGNVRELMNVIERGVVLARSEYLDINDISPGAGSIGGSETGYSSGSGFPDLDGSHSLDEMEKIIILKTIEATSGNKSEAARRLGITRKTLSKKLDKYGH